MIGKLFSIGILTCLWSASEGYSVFNAYQNEAEWDYLTFSQRWPVTFCIEYTDFMTDPVRSCLFPKNKLQWTIHGLWPSKLGAEGPYYCNSSAPFDHQQIEPIWTQLENFWLNLKGGKNVDSLWAHEWEKHGTCTMNFEPLNNELKYFKGGLDLYKVYNMSSILSSVTIFPDKSKEYSVEHIMSQVRLAFSKTPYVECVNMAKTNRSYLSEIRLCFNKKFEAIDCEAKYYGSATNCPEGNAILYPKDVKIPT